MSDLVERVLFVDQQLSVGVEGTVFVEEPNLVDTFHEVRVGHMLGTHDPTHAFT
jgi:hypothetical protein